MALKTFKPITPSLRQLVIVDRSDLYKGKPVKTLTEGKSSSGGRNNNGRITVRFRGGGHKQTYRIIDFKRRKMGMPAKSSGSNMIRTVPPSSRSFVTPMTNWPISSRRKGSVSATKSFPASRST